MPAYSSLLIETLSNPLPLCTDLSLSILADTPNSNTKASHRALQSEGLPLSWRTVTRLTQQQIHPAPRSSTNSATSSTSSTSSSSSPSSALTTVHYTDANSNAAYTGTICITPIPRHSTIPAAIGILDAHRHQSHIICRVFALRSLGNFTPVVTWLRALLHLSCIFSTHSP